MELELAGDRGSEGLRRQQAILLRLQLARPPPPPAPRPPPSPAPRPLLRLQLLVASSASGWCRPSIPRCSGGRPLNADGMTGEGPLLAQVCVWHRGTVAKGMLMADASLPPGYIVLRESMVKVHAQASKFLNLAHDLRACWAC